MSVAFVHVRRFFSLIAFPFVLISLIHLRDCFVVSVSRSMRLATFLALVRFVTFSRVYVFSAGWVSQFFRAFNPCIEFLNCCVARFQLHSL